MSSRSIKSFVTALSCLMVDDYIDSEMHIADVRVPGTIIKSSIRVIKKITSE